MYVCVYVCWLDFTIYLVIILFSYLLMNFESNIFKLSGVWHVIVAIYLHMYILHVCIYCICMYVLCQNM